MGRIVAGLLKSLGFEKQKKEITMTTKKVSFEVQDGTKPVKNKEGSFNLRAPMPFTLPVGAEVKMKLGVRCGAPVHVFQSRHLKERGIVLVDGMWAMHDANEDLVAKLRNEGKETVQVDIGEVIAKCVVIDNSDVEIVG